MYAVEEIVAALKAAREARGLSQRDLGALSGVPQSHISRIENGGADIRLSSLVALARALGLEVVLAPRSRMPAIEGVLRSGDDGAAPDGDTVKPAYSLDDDDA